MLAPFAAGKVCLEAQLGQREEVGVGKEAVNQLKMKCSPASCFARVQKSAGGGERRSDGTDGCAPAAPRSDAERRCALAEPGGSVPHPGVRRRHGGSVSVGRRPIVFRTPFNDMGTLAAFGIALSSPAAILECE